MNMLLFTSRSYPLKSKPKCQASCGITNSDTSYLHCAICNFTIHFACGSLSKNIKHWSHQHPLKLMNRLLDFNYDDQMCDICETKTYAHECVYYCAECYFVAELKGVLHEVMQSLLEKEPQDVELRTIQERNPEDLTFNDVFSSFTEKDRNQLDDITENMESEIAGLKKTLSENGDKGSKVTISERYPYSDEALAQLILRLHNGLQRKMKDVEFWDMNDVLVNVKVWARYTVTQKLAPMLKDLLTKYSDIDADCSLNENCSMYFFTMLCGLIVTKIMDATDFKIVQWWFALKHLQYAGFRIDFLFDQLKRIVLANYGTDTNICRKERLYELEMEKDKLSEKTDQLKEEVEQLTANIKELNLESREIKSSAQDSEISSLSLEDNRLSDLVRFRMNNAATGLL